MSVNCPITIIIIMNTKIETREYDAFEDASNLASSFPSGNLENKKNKATAANTAATIMYNVFTLVTVTFAFPLVGVPNKKKLTMIGPNVVPNEFTPPARFNLCEPVEGSPREIAKGCAAVCCNEKPSAIIKNETRMKVKEFAFADGIIANAPTTEIARP